MAYKRTKKKRRYNNSYTCIYIIYTIFFLYIPRTPKCHALIISASRYFLSTSAMPLYRCFLTITIVISSFIFSSGDLSTLSLKHNLSNPRKIITRTKIMTDMIRIRQMLRPLRPLFNTRDVYRKRYNMLKTLWTCCPAQRIYMFDIRDIHQTITGRSDCHNFIRDNKSRLTNQCQDNLRLFDPTRGDVEICDGRLLHNIAEKYSFVVQLSNYTERWCTDGLYPMLIYFNITQIIQCERDIRQALRNDPQAYFTYHTLSSNLLHVYVQNLNNYRDCNDPDFWDDQSDEETDLSATITYTGKHCG
jgi:hypothetical protein